MGVSKLLEKYEKKAFLKLFNTIYERGIIPQDWLKFTFVMIPKRTNLMQCKDYLSLTSHVLKIFLKIILQRVYQKIEEHIVDTQFGFCNGVGTREALFSLQVLTELIWQILGEDPLNLS